MFSVGDGKQKFVYSYKALESLKTNSNKNNSRNYFGLNLTNYKPNKKIFFPLSLKTQYNEGKPSKFYLTKNKEVNKINKNILNKKLDIFLNNAFDKLSNIRHYNSQKNFVKYYTRNLINKKNRELNHQSSSLNKTNKNFKIKIRNIILNNFNNFFPEKYINSRERIITEVDNKKIISKNNRKVDSYKKLFKIKYLKTLNNKEDKENDEESSRKRHNKLLSKLMTIYNKTNKQKFININNKEKSNPKKYIDTGLNALNKIYISLIKNFLNTYILNNFNLF